MGVASAVGVAGVALVSVVLNINSNTSNGLDSGDELGGVTIAIVSTGLVEGALLSGHLSGDWLADLSGHGVTPLHGDLDSDGEGDSTAVGDWLGHTLGVWDSSGDSVAHLLGHINTVGLGDGSRDGGALLSGHLGALGHGHTVGDGDTVRGDHGPGDWDTDWDSHTVGH